jgi:acyl carrier protein
MTDTIDAIKQTLEKIKGVTGMSRTLSDDVDIIKGVGLDSLQMLRFMLELEERLAVVIDFDRLEYSYFNSIRTLAGFMDEMPPRQPRSIPS